MYNVQLVRISLTLSPSLAIRIYHLSLPTGLLRNLPCLYRAVVDKFLLVVRMKGSKGERYL